MAMPKWRSIAHVVRTYDIPGEGPSSIKPQGEFRAPRSVVKRALDIKEVVEVKDRPERVGPRQRPLRQLPKPRKGPKPKAKAAPEPPKGDAEDSAAVVESETSSSATEKGTEDTGRPDKGKGKEKESKPQETKGKKSRSNK